MGGTVGRGGIGGPPAVCPTGGGGGILGGGGIRGGGGSCGGAELLLEGTGTSFFPSVGGGGSGMGVLDSILNANCRKNCFVSLFQCDHSFLGSLSTSLLGTLNAMVSYGSAANNRYCHFLSGGSTFCS